MSTIAQGSSQTFTISPGSYVSLGSNGGFFQTVETPLGGTAKTIVMGPTPQRRTFGPYVQGATLVVTNQTVDTLVYIDYEGGGGGGTSTLAGATDVATYDLASNNASVAAIKTTANSAATASALATTNATVAANTAAIATKVSTPTNWAAATNTPALTTGTAVLGSAYKNTSSGVTTLGTAIDGITAVNQGDMLVCFTAGTYTLVPAGYIVGIFANTSALQTAYPAANNAGASALVGGAAPYTRYNSDGNAWVQTTPSSSGAVTPDMFGGNSFMLMPLGLGTTTWSGLGASTSLAQVGTSTARSGQLASLGYLSRIGIVGVTAAANTNAYGSTSSSLLQSVAPSTSALFPTQRCRVVFCSTDANASSRMGGGFLSNTPTATVEPSTLVNNAWFAADSTDSQLSFMTCAGTGTATKTALNGGTGFPSNTNGADIYDGYIEFVGGATRQINYCITNRATGVKASGSVTSNLPDAGTNLRVGAYRNSAANAATPSIDLIAIAGGGFAQMGPTS